ncbi:hypothetical protein DERP_006045, partial [Dermatophagoides pteronyssinus]
MLLSGYNNSLNIININSRILTSTAKSLILRSRSLLNLSQSARTLSRSNIILSRSFSAQSRRDLYKSISCITCCNSNCNCLICSQSRSDIIRLYSRIAILRSSYICCRSRLALLRPFIAL